MYVDLTKPDPEPEPEPQPEPGPAAVEKERIALTAREELMLPLREFGTRIRTGSPVLGLLIWEALWRSLRRAFGAEDHAPAPAAPEAPEKPVKADLTKKPADGEDGQKEAKEEAAEKAPAKKATTAKSSVEQFALGVVTVAGVLAGLASVAPVLAYFLAPYTGWIILGVVVAWCLAAAYWAPAAEEEAEDATENDHENAAGEQDQERAPEADWARRRLAIRRFVEEAVAAGVAGHREEKGRGATVDSLLAEMREKNPLPGWDRKRMIEFLEMADIPVRDQVSFYVVTEVNGREKKVKKNLPAVHVDDLTKELGKTPQLAARFVPDITPDQHPHLAAVPPLAEPPAEAPAEGLDEGRSGVA